MAREYLGDIGPQPPKKEREYLGRVEEIGKITEKGVKESGIPAPGGKPVEPPGLGEQVLTSLYGIPVLAGGARAAQLATRGLPKVAPYTRQFAEAMIPKTGKELARATGAVTTGTAAAFGAGELLPPGTPGIVREPVQFAAGMVGEAPFYLGTQLSRALRPYTETGVERAGERVTRAFGPEKIEGLPQYAESRKAVEQQLRERLRGKPRTEQQVSAQDVATILGTDISGRAGRVDELARRMGAATERRAGRIGEVRQPSEIGDDARQALQTRLDQLKKTRSDRANTYSQEAFGEAFQKEAAGQSLTNTQAAKNAVQELNTMLRNPVTGTTGVPEGTIRNQINSIKDVLRGRRNVPTPTGEVVEQATRPSFEQLEIIRRNLRDRASGLPAEGYDAIGQQMAGRFADLVEAVQKEFAPNFGKFLDQYRKDSEPINQFKKAIGKTVTEKEDFNFEEFRTDPAKLADRIFATRNSAADFLALSGNDTALVDRLARSYLAAKTEGKTGDQLTKELRKYEWLNLPAFANVRRDFAEQARLLGKAETRVAERRAPIEAQAETLTLETATRRPEEGFRRLLTGPANVQNIQQAAQILGRTPGGQEAFKQAVRDTLSTEPDIAVAFGQKIKPAMQASGMYSPDEINEVQSMVNAIDSFSKQINTAVSRAQAMPGVESSERQLTRLIQDEVYQMRVGTGVAGALLGLVASGLTNLGVTTGGLGGAGAAIAGAPLLTRYREYNANIRKAVSDIVSDPEKLRQVMSAPRDQQPTVLARLLRTGLYSAVTATNEPPEER
jgi:hypothetical protein